MNYVARPTVHIRQFANSLNQHTNFQLAPLYWSGEPQATNILWSPKTVNQISLRARGSIGENLTAVAPAANSTDWLAWKHFLGVRPSQPFGYTSGRAIPGAFAPTSMANQYNGRTNV